LLLATKQSPTTRDCVAMATLRREVHPPRNDIVIRIISALSPIPIERQNLSNLFLVCEAVVKVSAIFA